MSDSTENLEKAQKNQKRVGAAESDPETTGPADYLRKRSSGSVSSSRYLQIQNNYFCVLDYSWRSPTSKFALKLSAS